MADRRIEALILGDAQTAALAWRALAAEREAVIVRGLEKTIVDYKAGMARLKLNQEIAARQRAEVEAILAARGASNG